MVVICVCMYLSVTMKSDNVYTVVATSHGVAAWLWQLG